MRRRLAAAPLAAFTHVHTGIGLAACLRNHARLVDASARRCSGVKGKGRRSYRPLCPERRLGLRSRLSPLTVDTKDSDPTLNGVCRDGV